MHQLSKGRGTLPFLFASVSIGSAREPASVSLGSKEQDVDHDFYRLVVNPRILWEHLVQVSGWASGLKIQTFGRERPAELC